MLHRVTRRNDIDEGKHVSVGGKFLEGESSEECAVREIFEETGYILTHYHYAGTMTFVPDCYEVRHMRLFLVDGLTGKYHDMEEGISPRAPKEGILKLPLWEGDHIFSPLLQWNTPLFSLKLCYKNSALMAAKLNDSPLPLRTRQKETKAGKIPA